MNPREDDTVAGKPDGGDARTADARALLTVTRPELLSDGSDLTFREMVHAALAFSSRLVAIRNGYGATIGLPGPQYTILVALQHLQDRGEVNVKLLADHLSLSGTFVTTETKKLEAAGLITKERGRLDGRRVRLSTTRAGDERLKDLVGIQQQVNNVHFSPLDRADFLQLHRILPELVRSSEAGLSLLRYLTATRPPRPRNAKSERTAEIA